MIQLHFVLGRKYALSVAEIIEVLKFNNVIFKSVFLSSDSFIIEIDEDPGKLREIASNLQDILGGTIKIAEILHVFNSVDELFEFQAEELSNFLSSSDSGKKKSKQKFVFGLSFYGGYKIFTDVVIKDLGISVKRFLESQGNIAKFVYSGKRELSSVTFFKKISKKGTELNLVTDSAGQAKLYLTRTIICQDFEGFSKRDYGRPMVSKKSGVLPPKLAKIMVNLSIAQQNTKIFDPFCGSGTIMQEALISGYDSIGSDISRKAVQQATQNLAWLKKTYINSSEPKFHLINAGIKEIYRDHEFSGKYISGKGEIGAIVTEPYLGPTQRNIIRDTRNFEYTLQKIEFVYKDLFNTASLILKSGQRLVVVVPVFKTIRGWFQLDLSKQFSENFEVINPISDFFGMSVESLKSSVSRQDFSKKSPTYIDPSFSEIDLVWDRPQSIIKRLILILKRVGA